MAALQYNCRIVVLSYCRIVVLSYCRIVVLSHCAGSMKRIGLKQVKIVDLLYFDKMKADLLYNMLTK